MNKIWYDTTSYSQRDKERVPRVWTLLLRNVKIIVHRHIHYDGWLLSCRDLQIDMIELENTDIDQAKQEAVEIVGNTLKTRIRQYTQILTGINEKEGKS